MDPLDDIAFYPHAWEFLAMIVYAGAIVWLGWLIKRRWASLGEAVPIPVALIMWAGMFALYMALPSAFYLGSGTPLSPTPDLFDPAALVASVTPAADRRPMLLYWCLLVWALPVSYYTILLRNAFAARIVDRIGPFSAHIEDPSEFAAARKLALRGDIDGAVALYRNYTDDRANALFEAARLLRSEDRFSEAAHTFQEIASRFPDRPRVWAEAVYHLGKLQEHHLGAPQAAMASYRSVIERAADSRFGELALNDLARLQVLHAPLDLEDEDDAPPAPAAASTAAPAKPAAPAQAAPHRAGDDDPVPNMDPFYARRLGDAELPADPAQAAPKPKAKPKVKPKVKPKAKAKAAAKPKAAPKAAAKPKPAAAAKAKAAKKAPASGKPVKRTKKTP